MGFFLTHWKVTVMFNRILIYPCHVTLSRSQKLFLMKTKDISAQDMATWPNMLAFILVDLSLISDFLARTLYSFFSINRSRCLLKYFNCFPSNSFHMFIFPPSVAQSIFLLKCCMVIFPGNVIVLKFVLQEQITWVFFSKRG